MLKKSIKNQGVQLEAYITDKLAALGTGRIAAKTNAFWNAPG